MKTIHIRQSKFKDGGLGPIYVRTHQDDNILGDDMITREDLQQWHKAIGDFLGVQDFIKRQESSQLPYAPQIASGGDSRPPTPQEASSATPPVTTPVAAPECERRPSYDDLVRELDDAMIENGQIDNEREHLSNQNLDLINTIASLSKSLEIALEVVRLRYITQPLVD